MRGKHIFLRPALVLCALGAGLLPQQARAQTERGVVLRFSGRGSGPARTAAVRAASDKLDLMGRAEVEGAAERLGADLSQPAGLAAVAQDQGLALIVTGEVNGRGRRATTNIHVFDDQGNEVAFREAGSPSGRANRQRIERAAAEAIDQALGALAQRRQEEAAARQRAEEEERRRAALAEAEAVSEVEEEEEEEAGPPGGLPRITAFIGLDGRTRDVQADFVLVGGGRRYDLSMYPELSLRLESFPLGHSTGALKGLYAQLDLAFALALSSQEVNADGSPGPEIDSGAWHMLLQAGYLYPLSDDAFRLGALIGFGIDSFSIGDNSVLASTRYTFLRLGAVADARLYQQLLRVRLDLGYRVVFGVGDIADATDPNHLGTDASGGAFDVGASLGGQLDMGFAYAVRFGFTRYSFDFTGDAASDDAVGAELTDKGVSLSVQVGYAY